MESKDPVKTVSAIQVFTDVFQEGKWLGPGDLLSYESSFSLEDSSM